MPRGGGGGAERGCRECAYSGVVFGGWGREIVYILTLILTFSE